MIPCDNHMRECLYISAYCIDIEFQFPSILQQRKYFNRSSVIPRKFIGLNCVGFTYHKRKVFIYLNSTQVDPCVYTSMYLQEF